MSFKPIGQKMLVLPAEQRNTTEGGIYLPDQAIEKPQEAEVIAIGDEVTRVPVGSRIVYSRYSGHEVKVDDVIFLILVEDEVFGYFQEEEAPDGKAD
jgi:Co-chaperonin GroES (HSP10)